MALFCVLLRSRVCILARRPDIMAEGIYFIPVARSVLPRLGTSALDTPLLQVTATTVRCTLVSQNVLVNCNSITFGYASWRSGTNISDQQRDKSSLFFSFFCVRRIKRRFQYLTLCSVELWNDVLERMGKGAVVAYFKVLSRNYLEETD
jgi:hypothetical protein